MEQGATRALDGVVFDSAPADDDMRPPGLLAGVTPITASTGTDAAVMLADLRAMVGAISDARVLGEIVFVMHPTRALALDVLPRFSHPVLTSGEIADDTVIAIAADGVASGYDGVPTIETSKFADPALALPASPTSVPDLLLLKLPVKCAWGMTQAGAVQVATSVKW